MKLALRLALVWALTLVALLGIDIRLAFAHGHTTVGDYELVIGFRSEPAYQGEPNGLDLRITNMTNDEPVAGLEETLQAEIIFGSSTREVPLRAQFGQEGAYTSDVLPTEAGDYTWHIWGEIEGTPVDVTMTSSPDTFSSVQAKDGVAFPAPEPLASEVLTTADAAAQSAQLALFVGAGGLLLGAIGTVAGVLGLRAARRSA